MSQTLIKTAITYDKNGASLYIMLWLWNLMGT